MVLVWYVAVLLFSLFFLCFSLITVCLLCMFAMCVCVCLCLFLCSMGPVAGTKRYADDDNNDDDN